MNALIYTESGKLIIRKPNGLEWEYENVDQPELGFDYEVLVYDDIGLAALAVPFPFAASFPYDTVRYATFHRRLLRRTPPPPASS